MNAAPQMKAKDTRKIRRPRPKKSAPADPAAGRVTRHGLARLMGLAQSLVTHYFSLPGAPRLDKKMRISAKEGRAWVESQSSWAVGGIGPEVKKLKQRKAELEVQRMEREEAAARGEMISKKDYLETLEALFLELEGIYYKIFSQELPPKYKGKTEAEAREMNDQGLLEASKIFKAGTARIQSRITPADQS